MERDQAPTQYQIEFSSKAERNFERLSKNVQRQISLGVNRLATDPFAGKPLKGRLRSKRSLRIGDYRIIYQVDTVNHKVIIATLGHRREVYDR